MMGKTITILSIHSCFGQKIGIGNAGGLNIYVHNLITFLLSKNHKIIFITSSHEYCELAVSYTHLTLPTTVIV